MKRIFTSVLTATAIFFSASYSMAGAGAKVVPIYPNAELDTPVTAVVCCSFFTKLKPYEDIVVFYEKHFNAKAMDVATFAKNYPAQKFRADLARDRAKLNPNNAIKEAYFVIEEMQSSAGKDAKFLKIQDTPHIGTNIIVDEKYLGPEWLKRKAKMGKN